MLVPPAHLEFAVFRRKQATAHVHMPIAVALSGLSCSRWPYPWANTHGYLLPSLRDSRNRAKSKLANRASVNL